MLTTYLQTAVIEELSAIGTGIASTKYELIEAPIAPYGINAIRQADGTCIHWAPHCIYKIGPRNTFTTWYNKPTIETAVNYSSTLSNYYQFNSDGTVTRRYKTSKNNTVELWWSPAIEGTISYGEDISTLYEL